MADEQKGVKVEAIHGTMQEPRSHSDAVEIHVVDGHLHLSDGAQTIAVYAPGKWLNAVLTK